jgi:hypothetical protein
LNSIKGVQQEKAIFRYIDACGIVPKNDVRQFVGKITCGASLRMCGVQNNQSGAADADRKRRPAVGIVVEKNVK